MAHFEEAYAIATRLTISGDAEKKLQSYWRAVRRANEATEVLYKRLRPLNDQLTRLDQVIGKLNPKLQTMRERLYGSRNVLNLLNNSFSGLNDKTLNSVSRFDRFNNKTAASIAKIDVLSTKVKQLSANMEGLNATVAQSKSIGGPTVAGRERKGASSRGGDSSNIHVRGLHLGPLGYNPGSLAIGTAAYSGYRLTKGSYQAEKEYQKALAQFDSMGFGDAAKERAVKFALKNQEKGISPTALLRSLTDAAQVLKDPIAAEKLAPMLARAEFANTSMIPGYNHAQNRDLIRAAEMYTGTSDPDKLKPVIEVFEKVVNSSGGRVLPTQFLNFMQTGGIAAKGIGLDTFYAFEPIIQEAGGHRTGTGLTSIQRQLQSGSMTQATAERLAELGLIDKNKLKYNKVGSIKKVMPGAALGAEALSDNPIAWFEGIYLPALAKKGITSKKDILNEINYDFGNRTGAALAGLIDVSLEKAILSMKVSPKAWGVNESFYNALNITTGKEKALNEAMIRFETALGKFTSPVILSAMDRLTGFLNVTASLLENISSKDTSTKDKIASVGNYAGNILLKTSPGFTSTVAGASSIINSGGSLSYIPSSPFGRPRAYVEPQSSPSSAQVQVNSTINIDGRKIAEAVTEHQVKQLNTPPIGTSDFNGRMSPIHPNYNFPR